MKLCFDKNKEYGLVLEGGGAKGSYQIGAWKAFQESGITFKGIAGASVGSLNGALIAMGDVNLACDLWNTITYSKIMDIDDTMMQKLCNGDWKKINWQRLVSLGGEILKSGGIDVTPLRDLIQNIMDARKIKDSQSSLYLRTISLTDRKPLVIDVKELPDEEIGDMLLASAYFPAFKRDKLLGKDFLDGGMYDNVPIDILIDQNYKDIFEFRINGIGMDLRTEIPEDVHVWKVEPKMDLGGILQFDSKISKRNITLGYYDAMRLLYGLKGVDYYIDAEYDEQWCYQEVTKMLLHYYDRSDRADMTLRKINEEVFPRLAQKICADSSWNYELFYLRLLEHTAKLLSIPKYRIYTEEELNKLIHQAIENGISKGCSDNYLELFVG